jgi:hypothetical protein
MKNRVWEVSRFHSGTHIVAKDVGEPYYYVYADERYQVCGQLQVFLNGGVEPDWMEELLIENYSGESCVGPNGIMITAVGPMVLPEDDGGRLNWQTNMSSEMINKRKELIRRLVRGKDHEEPESSI